MIRENNRMERARIEAIEKTFSLFNIQDSTLTLAEYERTASYDKFDASTRYVMSKLKEAGFRKVERLVHKADGKTSALDCIMPEAWDRTGRSFLEVVSPDVPWHERFLSDSDRHPQEAVIWSAPTPKKGAAGELVTLDMLSPDLSDAKGKWVFLESRGVSINGQLYRDLAKAGALGLLLTNFVPQESCPDDVVWFNGQGLCGWYHEKEAPRVPVFSTSPRRAVKMLERLKRGEKITVRGEMKTRIYEGEIYTVTAVIPGESKDEYALFAHLYEPFLADDALGFGLVCELGRQMVQRKVKLKKTLRIVFSMELYGFSAFLADKKHSGRIVAAMNLDGTAHWERSIDLRLSPISMPFFTDWFYRDWFQAYLPAYTRTESRGNLSDDTFGGDPDIGVPTNWLRNPGGIYHHNSGRYFEVDWRIVKEEFPVWTAAVETLLTEGPRTDYSRRACIEFKEAAKSIAKTEGLSNFERQVRLEAEFDRYAVMLKSWEKFTGRKARLKPLKAACEAEKRKIGPIQHELFSTMECRARNILVDRLYPGAPFSLSRVPYKERRKLGFPRLLWALFDGKRDLLTCIRIQDGASGGQTPTEEIGKIIESLRFLEKYGYVRLHPAVTVGLSDVEAALRRLGFRPGMNLVVHSALSAIGRLSCTPEEICRLLMKTVGERGTLLMPAFTFDLYGGKKFGQPFDMRNSSATSGILTETFRKMPGVVRSCDPCHSFAAWGRHSVDFVKNHHKVPTVSEGSPLGLLEAEDGWCLTIAAASSVTFMHVVESSFGVRCLGVRTEEFPAILSDGRNVRVRSWGWRATTCPDCPSKQTEKIFTALRKADALRETMLGNAQLFFFRLADYRKVYESLLREVKCLNRDVRPRVRPTVVKSDWDSRRGKLKKTTAFTGDLPGIGE